MKIYIIKCSIANIMKKVYKKSNSNIRSNKIKRDIFLKLVR